VNYQHRFNNTYLWGSYSPITGDQFVWEIEGVDKKIFQSYLQEFSKYKPKEYKIMIIDNARFHSISEDELPENIILLNIPPYTPELNPCEQVWQYIKKRYKNKTFKTMRELKEWLWDISKNMDKELIKSITSNHRYAEHFNLIK
jgi:transposase